MSLKIMKNKWSNTYKLWSDEAYIKTQQLWLLTTYTSYALFDIIWLENMFRAEKNDRVNFKIVSKEIF